MPSTLTWYEKYLILQINFQSKILGFSHRNHQIWRANLSVPQRYVCFSSFWIQIWVIASLLEFLSNFLTIRLFMQVLWKTGVYSVKILLDIWDFKWLQAYRKSSATFFFMNYHYELSFFYKSFHHLYILL